MNIPEVGSVIRKPYPFVISSFSGHDEEGGWEAPTWRPGVEFKGVYPDDTETVAHSMGEIVLTVVDVHKPGRYPTRVFFTRSWVDPNGKAFGKTCLRITTAQAFNRMAQGYRFKAKRDSKAGLKESAQALAKSLGISVQRLAQQIGLEIE